MVDIIELVPKIKARSAIGSTIAGNILMRYSDVSPTADISALPWGHSDAFCVDNRADYKEGHIVLAHPLTIDKKVIQQTAYTIDWEGTYIAVNVNCKEFIEEARAIATIIKNIVDKQSELRLSFIVIKKMWD